MIQAPGMESNADTLFGADGLFSEDDAATWAGDIDGAGDDNNGPILLLLLDLMGCGMRGRSTAILVNLLHGRLIKAQHGTM